MTAHDHSDGNADSAFTPAGIITLTTDFGSKQPYVAAMKGVIFARCPAARVIDMSHEIAVHWPMEAGFWLERSHAYFPAGTIHVAVVDPGVGTARDIVCLRRAGQLFIAPDNGLLGPLAPDADEIRVLEAKTLEQLGIERVSATFHGRDIFAPVAAELCRGGLHYEGVGATRLASELVPALFEAPSHASDGLRGVVVTTDHFGNIITSIAASELAAFKQPIVELAGQQLALARTYGDVEAGQLLALINSFDVLEVARAEGSAEALLGVERGAAVLVREAGPAEV